MSREDFLKKLKKLLEEFNEPLTFIWVTFDHSLTDDEVVVLNQYLPNRDLGVGNVSFIEE
jgi:hypothetical protein